MSGSLPADLRAAATLGGEMGRRLAAFDWAGHPLGDPADWPTAVRATVATALASRFPMVLWLGDRLRLIYNDAYIPALGDRHPAAFGQPGAQVWWDIWDVVGPLMDSVVTSGVATWSDDLMLRLTDKGRRTERYFTFTYSPILGSHGLLEGVFCAVAETTERVIGERRLQALNALSAALIDAQSTAAVLDAATGVFAAHEADLPFAACYLAGDSLDEARLARTTPQAAGLLPPVLEPLVRGAAASGGGALVAADVPSLLPDLRARFGDRCPDQALVLPLGAAGPGEAAPVLVLGLNRWRPLDELYRGYCGLLADQVSAALASARAYEDERRRAEALAELDEAKTAFVANVSHEFRTPLTLMLGPLEDVIGETRDPELRDRLEMVRRNGQRLLRLVSSLLEFSRIEAGRASPCLAPLEAGALTAGVASSFAEVCQLAGIGLILDCAPAWARVDAQMWETIVLNLVSNAFKHTFDGAITVRTRTAGEEAEITVADTGTGIAATDLPHLFDRFYRVAGSRGRSAEGSGIGLALTRGLVEMHGGTIEIASRPGDGTTVTIRLPRAPAGAASAGAASAGAASAGAASAGAALAGAGVAPAAATAFVDEAHGWLGTAPLDSPAGLSAGPPAGAPDGPLVLVADDNADMRAHLVRVLGGRWRVLTATDGARALELARRHHPDLLVADLMMPAMDGMELVATIRADPELALLPVVLLSARAGVEAAAEGLAAGADNYLVKPFNSADLVNRVAAQLAASARGRSSLDETAAHRDRGLAGLGTALAAVRSPAQALDALLAAPLCSLGATAAAIGVLAEDRGLLRMTYAGQVPAGIGDPGDVIALDAPALIAAVARSGEPAVVRDTARLSAPYDHAGGDFPPGEGATIIHPLRGRDGSVLGAAALSWPHPREFSQSEVQVTARAMAMLARAATRITAVEQEHQIAMTLQDQLLDLGAAPAAAVVSAAYQPAGEAMRVGGDWYTATPLDGQHLGVSVGDVAGHGLPAAAVMSQLRSALATAALAGRDPAAVLDLLDRYARTLPQPVFATVAYAVIDTAAETVEYSCAGHPYPLITDVGGSTRYLTGSRRYPLAARAAREPSPAAGRAAFPAGSLLLLYTDGLVERRDEALDTGLARLAAAAARCARLPAAAACALLLEQMAPAGGYGDDVALVAVRPAGSTPASHVDVLPADFTAMAAARARLAAWLGRLDAMTPVLSHSIVLGTGEALTNAIEHGSGGDPDRAVTVEAFARSGEVTVTVSDSGNWARDTADTANTADAARAGGRGRGLRVIRGLASGVQTVSGPRGTRVTMTFRVPSDRREAVRR